MRRFFRLVKNEYIKNFRLVSVWVMMILVVVAAVGIPALFKIMDHFEGDSYYDSDYLIEDELSYYNIDHSDASAYNSEYKKLLEMLLDNGVESTNDWRYRIVIELFRNGWNEAENLAADDEYFEYLSKVESGEDGYTYEDAEKMYSEKLLLAYNSMKESDSVKAIEDIVAKNDLTAWYNYNLKLVENDKPTDVNAPDYELNMELYELDIWFYTYLRDNEVYYANPNSDGTWEKYYLPEYYDERFYNALETYNAKKVVIKYEHGQESAASYKQAQNILAVNNYMSLNHLEFNVADNVGSIYNIEEINMWSVFYIASKAIAFVGLLVIVIAARSVSSEFSSGTIKFLLINPVKRWKILVSKYFTVISTGYLMLAIMFILSLISSAIFFGGSLIGAEYVTAQYGKVIVTSGIMYMIKTYLLSSVQIVVMSTIAFSISVLMKNSAFAIGISMLGTFAGTTVVSILAQFNQNWARYLIFANLDLAAISRSEGAFLYQNVGTAVAVIAVHMAVFWLIAWDGFTRREI